MGLARLRVRNHGNPRFDMHVGRNSGNVWSVSRSERVKVVRQLRLAFELRILALLGMVSSHALAASTVHLLSAQWLAALTFNGSRV